MANTSERTPLLRHSSTRSYRADDAGLTEYAVEAAVGAVAEGAADPTRDDDCGNDSSLTGNRSIDKSTLSIVLLGLWASNFTFAVQSSAVPTLAPRISSR